MIKIDKKYLGKLLIIGFSSSCVANGNEHEMKIEESYNDEYPFMDIEHRYIEDLRERKKERKRGTTDKSKRFTSLKLKIKDNKLPELLINGSDKIKFLSLDLRNVEELPENFLENFPKLEKLIIKNAEKIKVFPKNFLQGCNNLRYLKIDKCPSLEELPENFLQSFINKDSPRYFLNLKKLIIKNLERIEELPKDFLKDCKRLRYLEIDSCSSLTELPENFCLGTKLEKVSINNCTFLENLSSTFLTKPSRCKKLTELSLNNNNDLDEFPKNFLKETPCLEKIELSGIKNISKFPKGFLSNSPRLKYFEALALYLKLNDDFLESSNNLNEVKFTNPEKSCDSSSNISCKRGLLDNKKIDSFLINNCDDLSLLVGYPNSLNEITKINIAQSYAGTDPISFPEGLLCQKFPNLKSIKIDANLERIDESFLSQAPNLESIILQSYALTTLPDDFLLNCPLLKEVELYQLDIENFPQNFMINAPNLKNIKLQGLNYLSRIRENFCNNSRELETISIIDCHSIEYLNMNFREFTNLRNLEIDGCASLDRISDTIYQLPQDCTVTIQGEIGNEDIYNQITATIEREGYSGPRFIINAAGINDDYRPSIDVITDLCTIANVPEIPILDNLNLAHRSPLYLLLNRLNELPNFMHNDCKKVIALNMINYLEKANSDEKFRDILYKVSEEGTRTCGDRIALSIIHIDNQYQLEKLSDYNSPYFDINKLAKFLIRNLWTIELLETCAKEKIEYLKKSNTLIYEVETYLAYIIKLCSRLNIPTSLNEMIYFQLSNVTEDDLNGAESYVKYMQSQRESIIEKLCSYSEWRDTIKHIYSKKYTEYEDCLKIIENPLATDDSIFKVTTTIFDELNLIDDYTEEKVEKIQEENS